MLSERSSRALAGIRFPLVLMVLAMHVHPEALHAGPVFSPAVTALTQLGFMAVPCFFLMSGYLFFPGPGGLGLEGLRQEAAEPRAYLADTVSDIQSAVYLCAAGRSG